MGMRHVKKVIAVLIAGTLAIAEVGCINASTANTAFKISNGNLRGESIIEGSGATALEINKIYENSCLYIKSYAGNVNLKIGKSAKYKLNYKHLDTNKNGLKVFNGGGAEINVELSGGKLKF